MVNVTDAQLSTKPAATVAVCTRNRGSRIVPTIESILGSDLPARFEVLVVDQSTDDRTAEALEPFLHDTRVRLVRTDTIGIGTSRHLAVDLARSEYVAFTDDDCVVPASWLRTLVEAFDAHADVAMIYCNVIPADHDRSSGFVPSYERQGDHVLRTMRDKCRGRGIGAGMAVRRSAAIAVGNFDRSLGSVFPAIVGEEGDLTLRLLLRGHAVLETDRTWVIHDGFRTWEQGKDLTRRNFIGIGLVYCKPLRCGEHRAAVVTLYEGVVIALLQPLSAILRGKPPRGLKAFGYFWLGFFRGFRHPIDRSTMNYVVPGAVAPAPNAERASGSPSDATRSC
jgi:GT2 family glycosyltransferase